MFGLIYFKTGWKDYQRVSYSLDLDQARQHVIPLIKIFCKAYQQTTQTGLK